MGGETIGVPVALAEFLRQSCGLTCFFETGTAFGDSAAWASERFDQVITVEAAVAMFVISKRKLAAYPKVTGLLGDSRQHIRDLLPSLPSTLFWLDAHYSGTDTHGERDQCPLLGEIDAIAATLDRNAVMIDDMRMIAAPPPPPMRAEQWCCAATCWSPCRPPPATRSPASCCRIRRRQARRPPRRASSGARGCG